MPIRHVKKFRFPLTMIEIQYIRRIELVAITAGAGFRGQHNLWAAASHNFTTCLSRLTLVRPFPMAIRAYEIALGNLCEQPRQGTTMVAPIGDREKLGFSFAVIQIHHMRRVVQATICTIASFRCK